MHLSLKSLFLIVATSLLVTVSPLLAQDSSSAGFSNYQNTPISSILDIYEQLSGKHLIRDSGLNALPPISLNATGVSKAEMLKLIESALLVNGVAIIPVDAKTVQVVTTGKNLGSEGIKLYANAEDLPKGDEVVSYYMPLSYLNPQEAFGIFEAHAPAHPYGSYVPAPTAQAIVLTEKVSVIRQLVALKELIDVPPAQVTSEFVQLTRADAEKVADLLNKLLGQKGGEGAPAKEGPPVIVPAGLGENAPLSNEQNLLSGPAKIVPIPRSNSLLIVTRPVNLPFLRKMIAELDESADYQLPERRPLKYVLAQDILPALEESLAEGKDEEEQAKAATGSGAHSSVAAPVASPVASSSSSSGTLGAAGTDDSTSTLTDPPENNIPTVVTIGKTRIIADNRSNSIIVFGTKDSVNRVFSMIDELDRKPLQVYLSTVIGQLTVSQGVEFGIDILQKFQHVGSYGLASSQITSPGTTSSAAVPEPGGLLSSTGFPLPTGLTLYGAIGNTLNAYVRALETTDRFKIISRPTLYTTNNKAATIANGSQVPVPGATTSGFTGSSSDLVTTSNVQYVNVLLQLSIIPIINADHKVTLKIRQSNDSLGGSQNISGNQIPIIMKQKIDTEVTVPDNSTIVIGGLISDQTTRDTSGIPFLSDIPGIGYLFKDTKKAKTRSELIIMIQPHVIETDEDQIAVNEAEKARTILGQEAEETAPRKTVTETIETTTTQVRPPLVQVRSIDDAKAIPASTTTTQTIEVDHTSPEHSIVPAASSAAPDVGHARLPNIDPPSPTGSR